MLGFFDLEFKMDDINKHEPPLQKLDKVINWEIFRPILEELLSKVVFELKIKRQSGFQESPRFHQRIVHLQSPLPGTQSHVTFSNSFLHIVPA